jgi:hypothetical protein
MKHTKFLFIVFIVFDTLNPRAQEINESKHPKHLIKTYPLDLTFNTEASLAYEAVVTRRTSIEVIIGYNFSDFVHYNDGNYPFTLFFSESPSKPKTFPAQEASINLNYRFYISPDKKAPIGKYISPQEMYKNAYIKNQTNTGDYYFDSLNINKLVYAVRVTIGMLQITSKHLTLDIYTGLGARWINQTEHIFYRKTEDSDVPGEYIEDNTPRTDIMQIISPSIHLGFSLGVCF